MLFRKSVQHFSGPGDAHPTPPAGLRLVSEEVESAEPLQMGAELSLVLDALGNVLAAFAQQTFDMPDRPASESADELSRWQRHATLGVPLSADGTGTASGIIPRDWNGVVRTFAEHRRLEKRYVDSAVGDLRDALLTCLQSVHGAVKVDVSTDLTVAIQMKRARAAISALQLGSIKDEVAGALASMQSALQVRRSEQEEEYRALASRLDRVRNQLQQMHHESTIDALTGLRNRKLFDVAVQQSVQIHTLSRTPATLMMVDVDSLKLINDTFGHQAGDCAIVGVAQCLAKIFLRESDLLCRYGGDEFVAVLHDTDVRTAHSLAKRFVSLVGEIPPADGGTSKLGVSVGLTAMSTFDDEATWIARADQALYVAKQQGRSRVVLADAPDGPVISAEPSPA